ncbi:MAG: transcription elongation protein SprT [Bacteroidetes bacterium]|nr:MAG: transcription elongation protein SprT [Bacteroidota bacterium]
MSILEYLEKHLPTFKSQCILDYLADAKCVLKITKPRKTKRGDFRQYGTDLSISVNHDDNSYRFLFTLIHEIAHLKTYLEFKNKVNPHGSEWKRNFKDLFYYFKMEEEFGKDAEILQEVKQELLNPKACSGVSLLVEKAFSKFDEVEGVYLDELQLGQRFVFRNHTYEKLESRRTRVMCVNVLNKRKYTINKAAIVVPC